jgi:hypothetical protein
MWRSEYILYSLRETNHVRYGSGKKRGSKSKSNNTSQGTLKRDTLQDTLKKTLNLPVWMEFIEKYARSTQNINNEELISDATFTEQFVKYIDPIQQKHSEIELDYIRRDLLDYVKKTLEARRTEIATKFDIEILGVTFESEKSKHPSHGPINYDQIAAVATTFTKVLVKHNRVLRGKLVDYRYMNNDLTLPQRKAVFLRDIYLILLENLTQPFDEDKKTTIYDYWHSKTEQIHGHFPLTLFWLFIKNFAFETFTYYMDQYSSAKRKNIIIQKLKQNKKYDKRDHGDPVTLNKISENILQAIETVYVVSPNVFRDYEPLELFYRKSHEHEFEQDAEREAEAREAKAREAEAHRIVAREKAKREEKARREENDRKEAVRQNEMLLKEARQKEKEQQEKEARDVAVKHAEKEQKAREATAKEQAEVAEQQAIIDAERAEMNYLPNRIQEQLEKARAILKKYLKASTSDWYPGRAPWIKQAHKPFGGILLENEFAVVPKSLTMKHYVVKEEGGKSIYLVPSPATHLRYIPYGSFMYASDPGDLDVYCTQTLEECRKRYSDYGLREIQNTAHLQIEGIEIEIHHGIDSYVVQDSLALHHAIVRRMEGEPKVSKTYEALKKFCKEEGIYASMYKLYKGIALSLLAIAYPAELQPHEILKKSLDDFILFTLTEEGDVDIEIRNRNRNVTGANIMYGSSTILSFPKKREVAITQILQSHKNEQDFEPQLYVLQDTNYDTPDSDTFRNIQYMLDLLENDSRIEYAIATKDDHGKFAFASNDATVVKELWFQKNMLTDNYFIIK